MPKRMIRSVLVAWLSLGLTPAWSQSHPIDEALAECMSNDSTTLGIVECIHQADSRWDKELNANYQKTMKRLDKDKQILFRDAQRAWLSYLKNLTGNITSIPEWSEDFGTIIHIEIADMQMKATKQRTLEIEDCLNLIKDGTKPAMIRETDLSKADIHHNELLKKAKPEEWAKTLAAITHAYEAELASTLKALETLAPGPKRASIQTTQNAWNAFLQKNHAFVEAITPDPNTALMLKLLVTRHRANQMASFREAVSGDHEGE